MKKKFNRFIALILTVIMLASMLPANAFASLLDNSPEYNRQILQALEELAGSEADAETYYEALRQYGLLDKKGNWVEEWTIEYQGKEITKDGLKKILAGDYDPESLVWIDGLAAPLEDVKTMLAIDDYVNHIEETYFTDKEWTDEQLASYDSLMKQIRTSGLVVRGMAADLIGRSGINHSARVAVEMGDVNNSVKQVPFYITLTGAAPGQEVTFEYVGRSGSRTVYAGDTVRLVANSSGEASKQITVTYTDVSATGRNAIHTAGYTVFFVSFRNIRNALFMGDKEALHFQVNTAGSVDADKYPSASDITSTVSSAVRPELEYDANLDYYKSYTYDEYPKLLSAIRWGIVSHVEASFEFNVDDYPNTRFEVTDWNGAGGDLSERSANGELYVWEKSSFKNGVWTNPITHSYDLTDYPTTKSLSVPLEIRGAAVTMWPYYFPSTSADYHFTTHYKLSDTKAPSVVSHSAPSGTYYPGEIIPIVVKYSEPVNPRSATLKVNGTTLHAAESGFSDVLTFPYEVQPIDNTRLYIESYQATGIVDSAQNKLNLNLTDGIQLIDGVVLETPLRSAAFKSVTAELNVENPDEPKLVLTAQIIGKNDVEQATAEKLTMWMGEYASPSPDGDGTFLSVSADGAKSITAMITDGSEAQPLTYEGEAITGGSLSVTFSLPQNMGSVNKEYVAELYLDGELLFGKAAGVTLPPVTYITAEDIATRLTVTPESGSEYIYNDSGIELFAADEPYIVATYTLNNKKTFTYTRKQDFEWSSSDTRVATIDQNGVITPTGKAGAVTFRLTAKNGGAAENEAYVDTIPMTFGKSTKPFLLIYSKQFSTVSGEPLTIFWSSNLCDLNGSETTRFAVSLTRIDADGNPVDQPVYTDTITGDTENYAASATVLGSLLRYRSGGENENRYRFTVSSVYGGKTYSASTTVVVRSKPARVKLAPLDSYYILDTKGSLQIDWTITDFDLFSASQQSDLFRLWITRDDQTVYDSNVPGEQTGVGVFTGSYTLGDLAFEADPTVHTSYRQTYIVSIQAKNGSDSTWSFDSYIVHVYDDGALKIMVQDAKEGAYKNGTLTMSNRSYIAGLSQNEILALKRDISLHNLISANYGEYAWSELADQLSWASSNNDVATINYQQGSVSEDIRNFSYVSYRPTTDFTLSGLSDGSTQVTATHVLTGMQDRLNVNVETLKDRLYLFQFYPQTKTELTYTNGDGIKKTATSDASGAAAIYEESGIASDIYCHFYDAEKNLYVGTVFHDTLVSGEKDSTKRELYPCNNLTLRRATYAYIYLKNPDGTPYEGDVIFRGGVYVNDTYRDGGLFALKASKTDGNGNIVESADFYPVDRPGNVDQHVKLEKDGKLEIVMDQEQWNLPDGRLLQGDRVFYFFYIKPADANGKEKPDYYPVFASVDGTVNYDAYIAAGSAVVNFRKNGSGKVQPFVAGQSLTLINTKEKYRQSFNVLDKTGYIGISDHAPEGTFTTLAVWWGKDRNTDTKTIRADFDKDEKDNKLFGTQSNMTYPFVDEVITSYTTSLSDKNVAGNQKRAVKIEYYEGGENPTSTETMTFRLCNLKGVKNVQDSGTLAGELQTMGMAMNADAPVSMGSDDKFVKVALKTISYGTYIVGRNDFFSMKIAPTSDPTKFLGYISVNYADSDTNIGMMYPSVDSTAVGANASLSASTVLQDAVMLCTSGRGSAKGYNSWEAYKQAYLEEGAYAVGHNGGASVGGAIKEKKVGLDTNGTRFGWDANIGGYMESLIYYDFDTGRWTSRVVDGGFSVTGGFSYTITMPTIQVGPIPLTTSLTFGGNIGVDMNAVTAAYIPSDSLSAQTANEYLTQLRISLYFKIFAGVGYDYQIFSFKFGVFGKVSLDFVCAWLNRPYLSQEGHEDAIVVADGKKRPAGEGANLSGQSYSVTGTVGLEIEASIGWFTWSKTLMSISGNAFTTTGKWNRIDELWKQNQANLHWSIEQLLKKNSARLITADNQQFLSVDFAPTVQSRDYLEDGDRTWNGGVKESGMLRQTLTLGDAVALETNSYPHANPVLNADGSILAYISDQSSAEVCDTRAAFAVRTGNTYAKGGVIDDGGFGDQNLTVDGNGSFSVAAWSRQTANMDKDPGEVVLDHEQHLMIDSTDLYASVYDGAGWTTTRLTEGAGADVAPMVCTNGDSAIVVWHNGSSSGADDPTRFDAEDTLVYAVYKNGEWSEAKSLYNGTSGMVLGYDSAMLENGVAAVAYALDLDGDDSTIDDREINYAMIGSDGEVTRTVCATPDDTMVTNPQLAAVTFPGEEAERFVLGWYTYDNPDTRENAEEEESMDSGETGNADLCFLDFDENGIIGSRIPTSTSQMAGESHAAIPSDFRFADGAETIDELSIVWIERVKDDAAAADALDPERDVLKSVKFFTYGENDTEVDLSSPMVVADMPEGTLIDSFDAISESGDRVSAVTLGTTYGPELVTKTGETPDGDTVEYTVPKATSAMYTATDVYSDRIDVPVVLADYETVKRGAKTIVEIDVRNDGKEPVTAITVDIGGTQTTLTDLYLMPGDAEQCWADYVVPENRVVDPTYTVTATFESGETAQTSGKLYLDIPDLMITDARITREENGERDIQICLYNASDAALVNGNRSDKRSVKLSFFSDPTYENPIESLETVTISDDDELRMIDEGGYACQVTFEAAAYVSSKEDESAEIPEEGLPVYIKVEVIEANGEAEGDINLANNNASVICENLACRAGSDVIVTGRLETLEDGGSRADVNVQNGRMESVENGNVIANLLDDEGNIIEQVQSCNRDTDGEEMGLISLGGEEKQTLTLNFEQQGASVEYTFTKDIFGEDTPALATLSFSNLDVSIDSFEKQQNGSYSAVVTANHLSSTTMIASTVNENASITVKVNSEPAEKLGNTFSGDLPLVPGENNKITIAVVTKTGKRQKYVLTILNDGTQPGGDPSHSDDNLCKWCGELHTGFWGRIVGFFHSILYFFARLFGRR